MLLFFVIFPDQILNKRSFSAFLITLPARFQAADDVVGEDTSSEPSGQAAEGGTSELVWLCAPFAGDNQRLQVRSIVVCVLICVHSQ